MSGFDAMTWVMEPARPPCEEPRLGYGMAEVVNVGETFDDGTIRTNRYSEGIPAGDIWLTPNQAVRASYYGWRATGIVSYAPNGQELHLVRR